VDVVSSGDLVQRFEARWTAAALTAHLAASAALYRIKDRAFAAIADRVGAGTPTTEYDIQQLIVGWFRDEELVADDPPVVAATVNTGNPHYLPRPDINRRLGRDELVLLDLWAKLDQPGAVFADITWVGFTGRTVPEEYARAFATVAAARDAAVRLVQDAARSGADLRGWQVDQASRTVLADAGYADRILHRTGHSLGTDVHGNGVHMDDYETHDDRRLLPGTGFTIEPGVYFPTYGVRTEINMFFDTSEARVSGPSQAAILALG
jgi:Xaa-Pro aminopeptidase